MPRRGYMGHFKSNGRRSVVGLKKTAIALCREPTKACYFSAPLPAREDHGAAGCRHLDPHEPVHDGGREQPRRVARLALVQLRDEIQVQVKGPGWDRGGPFLLNYIYKVN